MTLNEIQKMDALNKECYDNIATEYDNEDHATCRDFDKVNCDFIFKAFKNYPILKEKISYLDIGVGTGSSLKSITSFFNADKKSVFRQTFARIDVLDISKNMLDIVTQKFDFIDKTYNKSIFDFESKEKYNLIISSLADPYLIEDTFKKFSDLLHKDSFLLLSYPAYEWVSAVDRKEFNKTVFRNNLGKEFQSFSYTLEDKQLMNLAKKNDFSITEIIHYKIEQIPDRMSDLNHNISLNLNKQVPFLTCIILKK